jgi:hypothetical protein
MESRPKKLLDQVRDAIRVMHYALKTEQAYVYWIKNIYPLPVLTPSQKEVSWRSSGFPHPMSGKC